MVWMFNRSDIKNNGEKLIPGLPLLFSAAYILFTGHFIDLNLFSMEKLILSVLLSSTLSLAAQELQPTVSQALLKVQVVDNKNKPQPGQLVTFKSPKDGKIYNGTTDAAGKFSILIPP